MQHDFGYFEENQLGKPYDLKLLKRLLPFSKPYRMLLFASVALVVFITMVDLAIPYITKIAIDRYIVPNYREIVRTDESSGFSESMEKDEKARVYKIDLGDPRISGIVEKYEHLFIINGKTAVIAFEDFEKIAKDDLKEVRYNDLSGVGFIAGVFLIVVVLNFAFNFAQVIVMEYTGQMIMHDLRTTLFGHIQRRSFSFFTRNPVGRLVTRVTNDVQNMHELFTSVITFVFKDLFLLFGIAFVLVAIDWKLALVSFAVIPFVAVGSLHFSRRAREAFRILRIKIAEINTKFSETIGGVRVIQLFRQEARNYKMFARLNHENYEAGMLQIRILGVFMPFIEFTGVLAIALVIYFGGRSVLADSISLGSLVAFISYMKMFFRPIRDIADKYNLLQNAMASAERIFLILDNEDQDAAVCVVEPGDKAKASSVEFKEADEILDKIERIEFQNVTFGYNSRENVLKEISLTVEAGTTVALVGPTGSGKTTLVNLIPRFYDPVSGHIFINGIDLRRLPPETLRSKMALVTQDPFLFSQSIRGNIFSETNHLSQERIAEIIWASNCERMIKRLPNGIETVLSEGGASISSGERQLISIARALAKDPQLIILDEATSYVDSDTEAQVQEAMGALMENRTAIVVAHRLTTARNAGLIVVLNGGRIIESGTHDELMAAGGFYFRLNQLKN